MKKVYDDVTKKEIIIYNIDDVMSAIDDMQEQIEELKRQIQALNTNISTLVYAVINDAEGVIIE
jgi:prefoldin subunit 5